MSFCIKTLQIYNELIAFIFCRICRLLLLLMCACKPHGVQCQVQLNFHPLLTSSICVWITTKPQRNLGKLFWLCLCGLPTVFFVVAKRRAVWCPSLWISTIGTRSHEVITWPLMAMESSVLVQPKRPDWHKHEQMQIHHTKSKNKPLLFCCCCLISKSRRRMSHSLRV